MKEIILKILDYKKTQSLLLGIIIGIWLSINIPSIASYADRVQAKQLLQELLNEEKILPNYSDPYLRRPIP